MMATAMPNAANCMPRLALSGRPSARRAVINRNAANRYASWIRISVMASQRLKRRPLNCLLQRFWYV